MQMIDISSIKTHNQYLRLDSDVEELKKSIETVEQVVSDNETEFNINEAIFNLEKDMLDAAEKLEFERAAALRDKLKKMKETYD